MKFQNAIAHLNTQQLLCLQPVADPVNPTDPLTVEVQVYNPIQLLRCSIGLAYYRNSAMAPFSMISIAAMAILSLHNEDGNEKRELDLEKCIERAMAICELLQCEVLICSVSLILINKCNQFTNFSHSMIKASKFTRLSRNSSLPTHLCPTRGNSISTSTPRSSRPSSKRSS